MVLPALPALPGVPDDGKSSPVPSRGALGDVAGTDWQRWLDKKQVKYFNKRTFATTITTPREVKDAETAARAKDVEVEDDDETQQQQQVHAQPSNRGPSGRDSLLRNIKYATVHGGFFYCSASRRQVLKNARLLLRPSCSTFAAIAVLVLRACLNAACTLDAAYMAIERWLTATAGGSTSGSAGSAQYDEAYLVSELVAAVLECAGVWLRIIALAFVIAALSVKVWCNRGFMPQVSLTIYAYRTISDIAAFSFLQYMPTAEHLRAFSATIKRTRRALDRMRTAQQDFQTDCDSRLLTGCCIKSACLVLALGGLLFSSLLAAMHVVAPFVVLVKLRSVALGVTTTVTEWSLRDWLGLVGFVNQIFSVANADEERKAAMLRLLLAPHESAGADLISLQETKLEAFEVSLVEALTEDLCEFGPFDEATGAPLRPSRPDCIVEGSCTIGKSSVHEAALPEAELPQEALTDGIVFAQEISSVSCSVAVFSVMTMRSADMETILRRVAHKMR